MNNLLLAAMVSEDKKTLAESLYKVLIEKDRYTLFVDGIGVVLLVAIGACIVGMLIGGLVAYARIAPQDKLFNRVVAKACQIYVTLIRGLPLAVLLLILYYVVLKDLRSVMSGMLIGIITFGLNSGAYVSEILRGGINGVDKGQLEAGRSLGFTWGQSMFKIVLPQGIKNCVPALFNEFIALVKETSILGFVGIVDLTKGAQMIISQTMDVNTPYFIIGGIYLVIVLCLEVVQRKIERRLGKGDRS